MHITEIWRFPLKSAGGERVARATLTAEGVQGDRHWALRRADSGHFVSARREPKLLFVQGRSVDGRLEVTLPDGTAGDDAVLSDWLGYDVELVEADPSGTPGTFEIDRADVGAAGFQWGEEVATWTGPIGRFHDSTNASFSLVSTATLAGADVRRFRTNLVVDAPGEDDLVGSVLQIGGATVSIAKQMGRCVMITRPQPGLDRDTQLLRSIYAERGGVLAVGGVVLRPGPIAVGDAVTVVRRPGVAR